jgi:hypothetical protein
MSNKYPKILWGSGFGNVITFGLPLDQVTTYSKKRDGYETIQVTSGEESAWDTGTDFYLEGGVRKIPPFAANTVSEFGRVVSTWDGPYGWRAFLEWAALKNTFLWYPDDTVGTSINGCYLVSPVVDGNGVSLENNGRRQLHLIIRNPSNSFDGY